MENIRAIRTEDDYDWALAEVAAYFENEPAPGTPEAERFDVLSDLIASYEDKHWDIDDPDPIEAIKYVLDQTNAGQAYLAEVLGSRSRASEVLNRKRALSLGMIQKIHTGLNIPSDVLIQPYHLARP